MFVTMVEAHVESDRESDLLSAWGKLSAVRPLPAGFVESSLLKSDDGTWRVLTFWESRDAVRAMRAEGRPAAVVLFEEVGARPAVSLCDVAGRISESHIG
jgi:heme-degrading monooxygenase HmoA